MEVNDRSEDGTRRTDGSATAVAGEVLPRTGLTPARHRLYATALRLFADRGFHAVSVRDITEALGQQPGALYAHAASKHQLLADLIALGVADHRDRIRSAVLAAGTDPVAQLRALVRAHVLAHLAYPDLARLTARELRSLDDRRRATAQATVHEAESMLLDVIRRGRRSGAFGDVDDLLAVAAIGAMGVRLPEWWTPAGPRSAAEIAETYAEFALRLVGGPAPAGPTHERERDDEPRELA